MRLVRLYSMSFVEVRRIVCHLSKYVVWYVICRSTSYSMSFVEVRRIVCHLSKYVVGDLSKYVLGDFSKYVLCHFLGRVRH